MAQTKKSMQAKHRLDFRKTSLVIAILYSICASALLVLYTEKFADSRKWLGVVALSVWIAGPQFILYQYVSKFLARWSQLIALFLQIAICFSLYYYCSAAFIESENIEHETVFLRLPIWHYVIVATAGLVMKIIESY